jgi:hypothetical protein
MFCNTQNNTAQAGLKFSLPLSASLVLEIEVYATMPGFML